MKNDLRPEHLSQEVTVVLPLGVVLRITEQPHPTPAAAAQAPVADMPAIGTRWEGGIYAGLSVEDNRPVALLLLDGDEKMDWNAGVAWAKERGGELPSRIDQLVLFKNVKSEFKEAYYWSGEQYAGDAAFAWGQGFGDGLQDGGHKGSAFRVRAVRRLPIQ